MATHSVVYGMPTVSLAEEVAATPWQRLGGCCIGPGSWTTECLTCGQRSEIWGGGVRFDERPAPDLTLARAITAYAARCRDELDQASAPVVSHVGLWMVLASVAEHVTGDEGESLGRVLGMSPSEATAAVRRLLAEPHPALAAATGAWVAPGVTMPLSAAGPIPDQTTLDEWARHHTRGLIDRLPVEVTPEILVLLASALVLEPEWTVPLVEDDGDLLLRGGLQTIVATAAAGLVAVAKPFSRDGIDVLSVQADPEVPPSQVWRAVDEVAAMLQDGALWRQGMAPGVPREGHSWRSWRERTAVLASEVDHLPRDWFDRPTRWCSRVRPWGEMATIDLAEAPGMAEVSRSLLPEGEEREMGCVQSVRAEYDQDGFRAAAVTTAFAATGLPEYVELELTHVELDLTGPHAVVAIARGGAWEGVPIVSTWVDGQDNREDQW